VSVKRCVKGKSCGATCIDRSERCVLELGPKLSSALTKATQILGPYGLYKKVKERPSRKRGDLAKFDRIKKQVEKDKNAPGGLAKRADLKSFERRLKEEGLLAKTKKKEKTPADAGALFQRQVDEKPKSVPQDLKNALAGLGGLPPVTPVLKRGNTSAIIRDVEGLLNPEFLSEFYPSSAKGQGATTGNTRWARLESKDFDKDLGKVRRVGSKSYDGWKDSYGEGARKIGEGSYGSVIRNKDGTFVKRGAISTEEAALIDKLGKIDLGPKLFAADINGPSPYNQENFVDIKNGRIAMTGVPGKPLGNRDPNTEVGGKKLPDIYWKAMAELHRQGIAHNDAHPTNILVDGTGKGRWVDLGLAQNSPKAALSEALGIFSREMSMGLGNWQTARWKATGVFDAEVAKAKGEKSWEEFSQRFPVAAKVWNNREAAEAKLRKYGIKQDDIIELLDHGIRQPLESYKEGPWARMTDQEAQEVLNTLYNGI
jgi:tRNA A-37 threonylcarbamoyl transferase component Bud32